MCRQSREQGKIIKNNKKNWQYTIDHSLIKEKNKLFTKI